MKTVKKFIKYLGIVLVFAASVGTIWHRFANPDMTEARWLIEYWYILLGCLVLTMIGYGLYWFGSRLAPKEGE